MEAAGKKAAGLDKAIANETGVALLTAFSSDAVSRSNISAIAEIQTSLSRGNPGALLVQLHLPANALVAPDVQTYLQQNALSDVIRAKADANAFLTSAQQDQLTAAMEAILQANPAAVISTDVNDKTPVDIAIQHELPEEIITQLQLAEQTEYDKQHALFIQVVATRSADAPAANIEEKEEKQARSALVSVWSDLDDELQVVRSALKQPELSAFAVSPTPVPTPKPEVEVKAHAPVTTSFTDAQKAQIELGRRLVNIKLTQVFTKGLAIKYRLVDPHNQNRIGIVVGGSLTLLGALVPIPGATLVVEGLIQLGKFVANKAVVMGTQKAALYRDTNRHTQRLGDIETMDQAAERVAALVEVLTRRFQCHFALIAPDSLELFIDRTIMRMVHYWDHVSKRGASQPNSRALIGQRLMDFMQPILPKASTTELSSDQAFNYLIENMVLGTSFWKNREADATGYTARATASRGKVGNLVGSMLGDRLVHYQTTKGRKKTAMMQTLCHNAPVVTWLGDKDALDRPRYVTTPDVLPGGKITSATQFELPPLYINREESQLRRYKMTVLAPLELPLLPPEYTVSPQQQELAALREQLALAQARALAAETRAEVAEANYAALLEATHRHREVRADREQVIEIPEEKSSVLQQSSPPSPTMLALQNAGFFTSGSQPVPVPLNEQEITMPAPEVSEVKNVDQTCEQQQVSLILSPVTL